MKNEKTSKKIIRLKSDMETCWEVQTGIVSPRDKPIGWRTYEIYMDRSTAERTAVNLAKSGGISRVLETREILVFHHESLSLRLAKTDAV
jgi:hypothetical protein